MANTDHKAKVMMRTIFVVLTISAAVSLTIEGFSIISLLLTAFSLLALLLAVTTPQQLQDFIDTLSD
ncbi:hypothetical protein [Undibacterium baiyunense]|uniref:Uncharacterized protein n=1 Tax=Undibacterium baiyunense TaxID=2828731 RepID=A0A941I595_9BURK|nr:hypothetical protein [Undibacterium baiyunense]MBR7747739.1 hypothetical protein [Undibacterium baiyunense]